MDATKFEWINSSNDDDQKYDSGKRRIIRVQAMRAAAASRKNSVMWGKHNMRQPEVVRYASSRSTDSSDASTDDHDNTEVPGSHAIVQRSSVRARSTCKPSKGHVIPIIRYLITDGNPTTTRLGASAFTQFEQWNGRPQRPMLLPGFEDLSAEIGVNVLDLDELTGVATGQVACSMLHQERTSLDKLIVRRRQSYLFHIPARYGVSSCLDDALRCIVTKAKRVLVGGVINPALDLQLYGRALRSLQNAVDKSGDWRDPNILGAIEILSIYELLDQPGRPDAWENHIAGAGRLIRARGPKAYKTEYEKALLASMVAPLTCEAIRLKQACFLEEDSWQAVLRDMVIPDAHYYAPRGLGYMYLWAEGAKLPGLIKDVYDVTGRSELYTDQHINGIEARARDMKESLLKWRRDYAKHSADAPIYREWSDDGDVRVEQYGAGLIMLCSSSRLLGAVCPAERIYQEKEAVKYSGMMRKLVNELIDGNQMASFYLNQKVVVADSVLSTTHLWLQGLEDGQPSEDRLIAGWKFRAWVDGYDDQFSHNI